MLPALHSLSGLYHVRKSATLGRSTNRERKKKRSTRSLRLFPSRHQRLDPPDVLPITTDFAGVSSGRCAPPFFTFDNPTKSQTDRPSAVIVDDCSTETNRRAVPLLLAAGVLQFYCVPNRGRFPITVPSYFSPRRSAVILPIPSHLISSYLTLRHPRTGLTPRGLGKTTRLH